MKLNKQYKPSECTDLNDIKTGIEKFIEFCDEYNDEYCFDILENRRNKLTFSSPIVNRRLGAYQNRAENLRRTERVKLVNERFNAFTYYMKLNF